MVFSPEMRKYAAQQHYARRERQRAAWRFGFWCAVVVGLLWLGWPVKDVSDSGGVRADAEMIVNGIRDQLFRARSMDCKPVAIYLGRDDMRVVMCDYSTAMTAFDCFKMKPETMFGVPLHIVEEPHHVHVSVDPRPRAARSAVTPSATKGKGNDDNV